MFWLLVNDRTGQTSRLCTFPNQCVSSFAPLLPSPSRPSFPSFPFLLALAFFLLPPLSPCLAPIMTSQNIIYVTLRTLSEFSEIEHVRYFPGLVLPCMCSAQTDTNLRPPLGQSRRHQSRHGWRQLKFRSKSGWLH